MPVTVVTAAKFINVTMKAIEYINEVNNAPKERATLAAEAAGLLSLLCEFPNELECRPPASQGFKALAVPNGSPEQFRSSMKSLAGKLQSEKGIKSDRQRLLWPLEKMQIKILWESSIEQSHLLRPLRRVIICKLNLTHAITRSGLYRSVSHLL